MTHHLTLELPDEVFQPLLRKAQEKGLSVETVVQDCVAEAVLKAAPGDLPRRWIGAFESNVPDAAERHHEYLGQALNEELHGRSEV